MGAIRDLRVAMDIDEMQNLGWFQHEYLVYGCCYWKDGVRHYRVSNQYAELGHFRKKALIDEVYPMLSEECSNRVFVPSGMEQEYMVDTKIDFAKQLQKHYPKEFLEEFEVLAHTTPNNVAVSILRTFKKQLIGCFDKNILDLVNGLVLFAYEQKKIEREFYLEFAEWMNHRLQQMEDDVVIKKNIKHTFYGFGFLDVEKKKQFYCNVNEDSVYKKRENFLEKKGTLCTSIISQEYYYNQTPNMYQEREKFINQLKCWMNDAYWETIQKIHQMPSPISSKKFDSLKLTTLQYDLETRTALENSLRFYKTIWNL